MTTTYTNKSIRLTITLDVQGANNQYVLEGFACHVSLTKTGGVDFSKASVEVFGLSIETMAKLTMLSFRPLSRRWNLLQIEAGESSGALSTIFKGECTSSFADLNGSCPVLKIEAQTGAYPVLKPDPQIAVKGTQSVDDLLTMLSGECGKRFTNCGVQASLTDCVLNGDPIAKMRTIADAVGADLVIDDDEVVLIPQSKPRVSDSGVPLISAETGMIGYPTFSGQGISVSMFFKPELQIGAAVRIESIVPYASGTWKIVSLSHDLSVNNPSASSWTTSINGMWLSE